MNNQETEVYQGELDIVPMPIEVEDEDGGNVAVWSINVSIHMVKKCSQIFILCLKTRHWRCTL